MSEEASKWHNMISTSDKTHIRALKEELKLGSKQITQLKAIEAISQRAAVKKGGGAAGDKTSGPGRRGVMDLYKDAADTFAKVDRVNHRCTRYFIWRLLYGDGQLYQLN